MSISMIMSAKFTIAARSMTFSLMQIPIKYPSLIEALSFNQFFMGGRAIFSMQSIKTTPSNYGVATIVEVVNRHDLLTIVCNMQSEMSMFLTTTYGQSKTLKSFEARFNDQATIFNSLSSPVSFPSATAVSLLLTIANV